MQVIIFSQKYRQTDVLNIFPPDFETKESLQVMRKSIILEIIQPQDFSQNARVKLGKNQDNYNFFFLRSDNKWLLVIIIIYYVPLIFNK